MRCVLYGLGRRSNIGNHQLFSLMSDEGIFPKINPKKTLFALELMSNKTSRGALSIHPWNDTVFIQKPDARNGKHLKSILIEMGFK